MMSRSEPELLSIGSVVRRTGITESTLRAWERRFGFPRPQRAASGHRRYEPADVEGILRVVAERERGADLATAIARVVDPAPAQASFFAQLRRARPELTPLRAGPHHMLALSRAIEEESLSRAEPSILLGAFQREHYYRRSERRWRTLAEGAEEAVVFADFERPADPALAPLEIPLAEGDPMIREWALICLAPGHAACLVGWEPPGAGSGAERVLEMILALDPEVVREAARVALPLVSAAAPERGRALEAALGTTLGPPASSQLLLSSAIVARMVGWLAAHEPGAAGGQPTS